MGGTAESEDTFSSVGGDGSHGFGRGSVDLCQTLDDECEECRFVAFAAMRGGGKIGSVRLDDDALKGNAALQHLRQRTFLKGDDTADAQHKIFETEQLACLLLSASEAVEDPSAQPVSQWRKHLHEFGMCRAGMDDER